MLSKAVYFMRTIIKTIPTELHETLFHETPRRTPEFLLKSVHKRLTDKKLDIIDNSQYIDIPLPNLGTTLPNWLELNANSVYSEYLNLANQALNIIPQEIPKLSKFRGWSKFIDGAWVKIDYPEEKVIVYDFEAKIQPDGKYLPFICSGIGEHGEWYSWIAPNFADLPKVVNFGKTIILMVGHNNVAYDRRYVKECYEYCSPIRALDTLSLYYSTMGMAGEQLRTYQKLIKLEKRPDWTNRTSLGGLKHLAKFLLGLDISKELREDMQAYSPEELENNLAEIWEYCARDTQVTLEIYKKLYKLWRKMSPSIISFGGMIERSCLRIGVTSEFKNNLKKVDAEIYKVRQARDKIIQSAFSKSLKEKYAPLLNEFEKWQRKEYFERLVKRKPVVTWLIEKGLKYKETKSGIRFDYPKPELYNLLEEYLELNPNIKPDFKSYAQWLDSMGKKVDIRRAAICPDNYLSIAGKLAPIILQMHWFGKPLWHNGTTWGVTDDNDNFIALPHPKGSGNVGTPLSKDFRARANANEFHSPLIDLRLVFENISTVSVWESFRDRFNEAYIYNDVWLTDVLPCGTITERMTGLAVVMPNTKPNRAGTECKQWFGVSDKNHLKISADYSMQESYVFASHIDAEAGYTGCNVVSCLTMAGSSDNGTDTHTTTSKFLVSQLTPEQAEILKKNLKTENLVKALRFLAKNMNFANQFLCGYKKLGVMMYIALQGMLTLDDCENLAKKFITQARGEMVYGDYVNGDGSPGYNRLKRLCKEDVQTSAICKKAISIPLQARYVGKDFMTTRFNFNIQQTGQELVNICLITCRILSKLFDIPYQVAYIIHDEVHIESHMNHVQDVAWIMQLGHMFSKAMLYHSLKVASMPQNNMWFDTVEVDYKLRKSVDDVGVTPSNPIPNHPGYALKAKDCLPSARVMGLIEQSFELVEGLLCAA